MGLPLGPRVSGGSHGKATAALSIYKVSRSAVRKLIAFSDARFRKCLIPILTPIPGGIIPESIPIPIPESCITDRINFKMLLA